VIGLKDELLKTLEDKKNIILLENWEQFKEFCVFVHSLGIHHRYRTTFFESVATDVVISMLDDVKFNFPAAVDEKLNFFCIAGYPYYSRRTEISVKELKNIYNNLLPNKIIII